MNVQLIILFAVSLLICFRKCMPWRIPVWTAMLLGAIASLFFVRFSACHILSSIKWDVIFYLIGVFFIVEAAEASGFLGGVTSGLFARLHNPKQILFMIIFLLGSLSAVALNDTTAIIGVPLILKVCRNNRQLIPPFMLALAFSVTIGSVMSPIGNPQNLIIASQSHMQSQFLTFIEYLAIPTIISLFITYLAILFLFRKEFKTKILVVDDTLHACGRTALGVKISIIFFIILLILKVILSAINFDKFNLEFGVIALISAIPVLIIGKIRIRCVRSMDWGTILFFIAMFILMQNVWDSGFFQLLIKNSKINISSIPSIFVISLTLSQLMSNVPLVTLYMPILAHGDASVVQYMALAAASTIAGNIYILGAASTIIIIQNSEKKGIHPFKTRSFSLIGIPLTLVCAAIYYAYLTAIL